MALFKFLKTPKPAQYDYKPRFWDPEKEKIERRLAELESKKKEKTAEEVKGNLSGSFRASRRSAVNTNQIRKDAQRKSNYTLIAIIFVLVLLAYVFLNVNLPSILEFVK